MDNQAGATLTAAQLNELKHFHVFGDCFTPVENRDCLESELYEMGFLDRAGLQTVFCKMPISSHWRYSLNEAGRAAILQAEGCLPKVYEPDWDDI